MGMLLDRDQADRLPEPVPGPAEPRGGDPVRELGADAVNGGLDDAEARRDLLIGESCGIERERRRRRLPFGASPARGGACAAAGALVGGHSELDAGRGSAAQSAASQDGTGGGLSE